MKIYWALAVFAFVVLGAAAVWMGGLNQDEGWYLYAANMVAEGQVPYRDFFFTQGPVMPWVYSAFAGIWKTWGLLGARVFTLGLGVLGIVLAMGLARRLAPDGQKGAAGLIVLFLLGCNLYHLYYVAIPKTYALASLFVLAGFFLATFDSVFCALGAGILFTFAAGTRISLGAILPVVGFGLLLSRRWRALFGFFLGCFGALALVYGPFLCDAGAREGLLAAQQYHAARGGFDLVWTVGSVSRLVRWYLPVFIVLGLGGVGLIKSKSRVEVEQRSADSTVRLGTSTSAILLWGFFAVFAVQMLAPFPYEDYQVPVMGVLAVYAAVNFVSCGMTSEHRRIGASEQVWMVLLVLGLCFANSFGSPLLEKWMTNGQDRFWSLKKEKCELAQLRDVAKRIEALDPDGKTIFTQDLYLAIEMDRTVPRGLEMGPFAMLTDAEWQKMLTETAPDECAVAALSGYSFAICPPKCDERPVVQQMDYWAFLKKNFELVGREEAFGQNATPLLILKRK